MNEKILEKAQLYQGYGTELQTALHPIVVLIILIAGIWLIVTERRNVLVIFLFIGIFIPSTQRIMVAGLNFNILRIMILLGLIRLIMRSEIRLTRMNTIDHTIIIWGIYSIISYTLLRMDFAAFINRMGFLINSLGAYFLFRYYLRDLTDIDRLIRSLVIISVILAFFMLIEQVTAKNMFSVFGLPENTPIRGDRLRSQGTFAHSITAGIFGATLMPLFVSLWWNNKKLAIIGFIATFIITLTSSSSAPVIAYCAGIVGLFMWPYRRHMRIIRWGFLFSIITLHVIMKAPVWFLIGRVDIVEGSTGWHRAKLIDTFIRNFSDWWLIGTQYTYNWGYQMFDITNQYVAEGIYGGLLKLLFFIAIISLCLRSIGLMMKGCEGSLMQKRLWTFGTSLFVHVVGFFGISYFDQISLVWYFLLAMISIQSSFYYAKIYDLDQDVSIIPEFAQNSDHIRSS